MRQVAHYSHCAVASVAGTIADQNISRKVRNDATGLLFASVFHHGRELGNFDRMNKMDRIFLKQSSRGVLPLFAGNQVSRHARNGATGLLFASVFQQIFSYFCFVPSCLRVRYFPLSPLLKNPVHPVKKLSHPPIRCEKNSPVPLRVSASPREMFPLSPLLKNPVHPVKKSAFRVFRGSNLPLRVSASSREMFPPSPHPEKILFILSKIFPIPPSVFSVYSVVKNLLPSAWRPSPRGIL